VGDRWPLRRARGADPSSRVLEDGEVTCPRLPASRRRPAGADEQAVRVTCAGVGSSRPQHRATRPGVPAFFFAGVVDAWVRRRGSGQCRCPAPPRPGREEKGAPHGLWRRHLRPDALSSSVIPAGRPALLACCGREMCFSFTVCHEVTRTSGTTPMVSRNRKKPALKCCLVSTHRRDRDASKANGYTTRRG
jgi:hypothetical protein